MMIKESDIFLRIFYLFLIGIFTSEKSPAQTFRDVFDVHATSEGIALGAGLDYFEFDANTLKERLAWRPAVVSCKFSNSSKRSQRDLNTIIRSIAELL